MCFVVAACGCLSLLFIACSEQYAVYECKDFAVSSMLRAHEASG